VNNIKAAIICLSLACVVAISGNAGTIVVGNTNDNGPGSLRQALADANDGDTIDATGVSGVITLTTGELLVDKSVTINGSGSDSLAVDGNAASAVFHITAIGSTTISGLTIRNGQGGQTGFGGAVINSGATLTIHDSTISGNTAGFGAGIYNSGMLTTVNTTITDNIGPIIAGGSRGAGIYNTGTVTIVNSTVSNNIADVAAGLYNGNETLTITNSTVSGNAAGDYAGGIFNLATLQIFNSTLSGNSASFIACSIVSVGIVQIGDTILNAGASVPNIFSSGTVTSLGYNLSSDTAGGFLTGPGDQVLTDPMLGPLQNNGGLTFTHELLRGSPAINAGNPGFTPPPLFDQRGPGFDRVVNSRIDIGSFEVQPSTPTATPSLTPTPSVTPTATATVTATSTPTVTATPTTTASATATSTPSPRAVPTRRPRLTPVPRADSGR
jgi:hypothetical protein